MSRTRAWYLLPVIPFLGLLSPPLYAKDARDLWGIPFFEGAPEPAEERPPTRT